MVIFHSYVSLPEGSHNQMVARHNRWNRIYATGKRPERCHCESRNDSYHPLLQSLHISGKKKANWLVNDILYIYIYINNYICIGILKWRYPPIIHLIVRNFMDFPLDFPWNRTKVAGHRFNCSLAVDHLGWPKSIKKSCFRRSCCPCWCADWYVFFGWLRQHDLVRFDCYVWLRFDCWWLLVKMVKTFVGHVFLKTPGALFVRDSSSPGLSSFQALVYAGLMALVFLAKRMGKQVSEPWLGKWLKTAEVDRFSRFLVLF